ncbi:hypothetical protein LINPERHAP1_LOCUS35287, partial [Linum perenne]
MLKSNTYQEIHKIDRTNPSNETVVIIQLTLVKISRQPAFL